MALTSYPRSTQWITFPLRSSESVEVQWNDGSTSKRNTYYVSTCYWGELFKTGDNASPLYTLDGKPRVDSLPNNLKIHGETKIFIAKQYIDDEFIGGPIQGFHLKSSTNQLTRPNWITLQLNEAFHYGQSGDGEDRRRWLVYHPAIQPHLQAPQMFQHRFAGPNTGDLTSAAVSEGLIEAAERLERLDQTSSTQALQYVEAVKSSVGEPLHRFLDAEGHKMVEDLFNAKRDKRNFNKSTAFDKWNDERLRLVAFVEDMTIKADNYSDLKHSEARIEASATFLTKIEGMLSDNEALFTSMPDHNQDHPLESYIGGFKMRTDSKREEEADEEILIKKAEFDSIPSSVQVWSKKNGLSVTDAVDDTAHAHDYNDAQSTHGLPTARDPSASKYPVRRLQSAGLVGTSIQGVQIVPASGGLEESALQQQTPKLTQNASLGPRPNNAQPGTRAGRNVVIKTPAKNGSASG